MSEIELNLKPRPGPGNSIKVDGIELGGLVSHIHLDADCTAGPVLRLQMPAISTLAIIDARVVINAIPVTDEIGREIFKSLRARYEGAAP